MNVCRKKQWHTFKVQGVKHKRRRHWGSQQVLEVSSLCHHQDGEAKRDFQFIWTEKTKTDSWSDCGERRKSETSYHPDHHVCSTLSSDACTGLFCAGWKQARGVFLSLSIMPDSVIVKAPEFFTPAPCSTYLLLLPPQAHTCTRVPTQARAYT